MRYDVKIPYSFWYGLLIVLSLSIFIYTLWKVKDKKVVALYTFLSGVIYLFEYVVLVLNNSYVYKPNLLKNNYFDEILGAVVSDAFSVPMAAAFVGAFRLGWRWMLFITGIFIIIEWLFEYIGAYEQHWWKAAYTGIGILLCFSISKIWYKQIQVNLLLFVRFITLYFTCLLLQASTVFVLVAFFGKFQYHIGWFANAIRDHVSFATAYILFLSLIFTSLVSFNIRWRWKIATLLLTVPIDWSLLRYDILTLSNHWTLGHFLILRFGILILLGAFNHFFLGSKSEMK